MKLNKAIIILALMTIAIPSNAQLTINIRYSGEKGAAKKYVKEMEQSGIAARIRAVEGCIRYDYFFPADDPEGLLLIDEWADQAALDRYHSSPMMKEAAALREKYSLGGRQIRMFNPLAQNNQTETKAQNMNNALTPRRQGLAVIASLEAKGDQAGLEAALADALDNGLTVSEAKEALSQLYAYTGFPRSLNALGTLQKVLARREAAGIKDDPGKDADPLPAGYVALKQGTTVQTQLTGKPFDYSFVPATDYYLKAHLFGDIFARNNLNFADREIVTVSAISALPGCEPQLIAHVSGARNMGVSDAELRALPALLEEKVGTAEAERLRGALKAVLGDAHTPVQTVDFSVWPKGQPNTAYAQYFTGNSYLAPMDGGVANVTFEPGCRNNWHIHHRQVQVLICVAGRGWYQEWGKPAVQLVPGTVVEIPEGVKHWHGAAADSWMQHLTYHKDVQEGASNEWLEPVSDEQYFQE
ncbi:MAG: carboxymuconolactone decarboxylase family protein [Bacteroidales bacterium]|nr:carboxymuconolactone decarboxylase family protein [Bacteroidales bacterium]